IYWDLQISVSGFASVALEDFGFFFPKTLFQSVVIEFSLFGSNESLIPAVSFRRGRVSGT
ncbi:hypothetical protein L195_g051441, partial [Trifolium pratense]